ncbi:MAG: D-aminoacyl-tRNA deacylase [Thermoplasmata archaeon]|nr:D-aminoacyl-tRNA deacylase [Thermoplasmata archaeon]
MAKLGYLVVLSEADPVARAVESRLGPRPSLGMAIDGVALRELGAHAATLRRGPLHIHDDELDQRILPETRSGLTLIFPSIHESAAGQRALTVHPIGNPTQTAEVGGRPGSLVPSSPRLMAAMLRRLAEGGLRLGWSATYEATHHGPFLTTPAFFAEIGAGGIDPAPAETVELLAESLRDLAEDPSDRVAVGVGGGHYAPHFTGLALERRVAFGHLFSRHVLEDVERPTIRSALEETAGVEGIVYARAADAQPKWLEAASRIRDSELKPRTTVTRSS